MRAVGIPDSCVVRGSAEPSPPPRITRAASRNYVLSPQQVFKTRYNFLGISWGWNSELRVLGTRFGNAQLILLKAPGARVHFFLFNFAHLLF